MPPQALRVAPWLLHALREYACGASSVLGTGDARRGIMSARILCAVDFSAFSRQAMRVAADLARERRAGLELVNVEERPLWENEPFVHLPGDVRHDALVVARSELEAWRREAEEQVGAAVVARTVSGVPWSEIVAIANDDATIEAIVMGTHGRSGISRALIGSVAERVVRHAPCSVLIVRPLRGTSDASA